MQISHLCLWVMSQRSLIYPIKLSWYQTTRSSLSHLPRSRDFRRPVLCCSFEAPFLEASHGGRIFSNVPFDTKSWRSAEDVYIQKTYHFLLSILCFFCSVFQELLLLLKSQSVRIPSWWTQRTGERFLLCRPMPLENIWVIWRSLLMMLGM